VTVEPDDESCSILHVDMDAFYASVEVRRRPELRGRPVVVGGAGPRGVVSSASYEARAFGVRSAMPGSQARRLCPQAVFLPPDMAAYVAASREIMRIFTDVTPLVEPLSVDEAFLDVSGALRLFGRPRAIADHIRERVRTEQGLTCSVGVAATKFMAKLASERAKPDGVVVVPAARTLEFLHPLPVEVLWGVGDRTCEVLRRLGLRTVGDVADAPVRLLRQALGEAAAAHLHELSHGRDPRRVSPERVEKSAGSETTFDEDVADPDVIRRTLLGLATGVARRLRRTGHAGRPSPSRSAWPTSVRSPAPGRCRPGRTSRTRSSRRHGRCSGRSTRETGSGSSGYGSRVSGRRRPCRASRPSAHGNTAGAMPSGQPMRRPTVSAVSSCRPACFVPAGRPTPATLR
jgi:DNA polymerase-4